MELGIVVGCDQGAEWLLEWWWTHYRSKNDYPVAFMDMGMSDAGAAWCRSKGVYFSSPIKGMEEKSIDQALRKKWEEAFGASIWDFRSAWLKKPFAMAQSPFDFSCWLDLDCEVRCSLEPLFNILQLGFDLALVPEPIEYQWGGSEINYNAGVIAYRKNAPILNQWQKLLQDRNDQFPGDQEALARAIHLNPTPIFHLNPLYNWKRGGKDDEKAFILHYRGSAKQEIFEKGCLDFLQKTLMEQR